MSEDKTSQNEGTESAQSIAQIQATEPPRTAEAEPATEKQLQEIKQEMSAFERSTLRWTKVTCGVFAVTLVFIALQWSAIRGQLEEMKSSGKDTHDLAVAAGKQADATTAQAIKMAESLKKTDALIEKAAEQTKATNFLAEQAKRSAKAAEDGLISTRESLQMQERPWVGVKTMSIVPGIEVGVIPSISITMENTGRSPAIHYGYDYTMAYFCGQAFPRKPQYNPIGSPSSSTLFPGGVTASAIGKFIKPMTESDIASFRSGTCILYAYARITYLDVFKREHWRHFCAHWDSSTAKVFLACPFYNDGDEDYPDGKEPN